MAEAITIPSPSVFLRSPVLKPTSHTHAASKRPTNTTRKSSSETATNVDGTTKPKQSKSRNGCITCKAKRLKCDETKPACQQCHKRNVECGGYKKDFKWRPFEESSFVNKQPQQAKAKRPSSISIVKAKMSSTSSLSSPAMSDASIATSTTLTPLQDSFYPHPAPPPIMPIHLNQHPTNDFFSINSTRFMGHSEQSNCLPRSYPQDFASMSIDSSRNSMLDDGSTMHSTTAPSSYTAGQSPKLIDLLLPGTDMNARAHGFSDFGAQQTDMLYQPFKNSKAVQEEQIEEIIRQPESDPASWIMRLPSPCPSTSTSSSGGSTRQSDPYNRMYQQPQLSAGSPEMLMLRFDKQTCGILSIKDGPNENPWRTLVWPLARESPALYHAISSMTAFHAAKEKPSLRMEGMEHMRQSIMTLAGGIENMRVDAALATTLVLAFAESWDQHISTGIQHLRGAKVLVDRALMKHNQSALTGDNLNRMRFLVNSWVYMDVIARLTSIDEEESTAFDATISNPFMTMLEVDPLMGCASALFPLIGRVANLVRKVRRSERNSLNIISQASELKTMIENWQPGTEFDFELPEDPTSDISHCLQTAEAYRWATLLYLHQAVPEVPSLPASELAQQALRKMANVPLTSRTIIVHIYPLLAAGCEAITMEDRQWVKDRWTAMANRMWIGNIDRCWEVIKEVWERRDVYEMEKMQQDTMSCVTSQSGSPTEDNHKRKFSADSPSTDFFNWSEFGGGKRRATAGALGMPHMIRTGSTGRKFSEDAAADELEYEKTVRGRLHWLGVMQDWKWEVLLG